MTRPALKKMKPSDKLVRTDLRYQECPACGRRGYVTDAGTCAAPREITCAKRAVRRALR